MLGMAGIAAGCPVLPPQPQEITKAVVSLEERVRGLVKLDKFEEAEKVLCSARAKKDTDLIASLFGQLYVSTERWEEAVPELERAMKAFPDRYATIDQFGRLL